MRQWMGENEAAKTTWLGRSLLEILESNSPAGHSVMFLECDLNIVVGWLGGWMVGAKREKKRAFEHERGCW